MLNINKIKELAKKNDVTITHICEQFNAGPEYLDDVSCGKITMSDDRIFKIAHMLNTTYEYLTDMTDDPDLNYASKQAESPEEKLIHAVIERVMQLPLDQVEVLQSVFDSNEENFDRIISALKSMIK